MHRAPSSVLFSYLKQRAMTKVYLVPAKQKSPISKQRTPCLTWEFDIKTEGSRFMLYVLICKDLPGDGLARRLAARPNHLAYLESLGAKVRAAGGMLSEDGKEPRGSLIIIEADSLDEARAIAAADPYAKAGVFADVEIHPWRQAAGTVSLA
jgi:uncharacterized protein YciI